VAIERHIFVITGGDLAVASALRVAALLLERLGPWPPPGAAVGAPAQGPGSAAQVRSRTRWARQRQHVPRVHAPAAARQALRTSRLLSYGQHALLTAPQLCPV
jgi:hypothetical protein